MIDVMDSTALFASVETVKSTTADSASRMEAKVRFVKVGFVVFMAALFP
jgi:hypothetical protein